MKATARKKRSGKAAKRCSDCARKDATITRLAVRAATSEEQIARIRELLQSGTRDVSGTLWLKEAAANELMELIR